MTKDRAGNRIKVIKGYGDHVAWSCHTDTVHTKGGVQLLDIRKNIISLNEKSKSNCLGADDGAGMWLMLEMIKAKVPGRYFFHRGEEKGGIGSNYIASFTPGQLDDVKAIIALDRKGYRDIITRQWRGKCASPEFATSLALALNAPWYSGDPTGSFTDTANYRDLVQECSNLSVGYFSQHGSSETLDLGYLCALREHLIKIDHSKLVFKRDPDEEEYESHYYYGSYHSTTTTNHGGRGGWRYPKETKKERKARMKKERDEAAADIRAEDSVRAYNYRPRYYRGTDGEWRSHEEHVGLGTNLVWDEKACKMVKPSEVEGPDKPKPEPQKVITPPTSEEEAEMGLITQEEKERRHIIMLMKQFPEEIADAMINSGITVAELQQIIYDRTLRVVSPEDEEAWGKSK